MLNTPHISVGLVIGRFVPNPVLAFLFGVISHFFLDATPHWDGDWDAEKIQNKEVPRMNKILLAVDFLSVLFIFGLLLWKNSWSFFSLSMLTAAFGAISPDIFWVSCYLLKFRAPEWYSKFNSKIHRKTKILPGIILQTIVTLVAFLVIY